MCALRVRRPTPAARARLPVVPVPFAAALGAQPGLDTLPAPGGQIVPVRLPFDLWMPVPVPGAGVLQAPPAARAAQPVGPVSVGAALHAQPGRAVTLTGAAGRAGPTGAPAARAVLPVGAVPVPAATVAQPGRAVTLTGARRTGRQGPPARVHDDALVGSAGNADPTDPRGAGDSRPTAALRAPGARRDLLVRVVAAVAAIPAHGGASVARQPAQRT